MTRYDQILTIAKDNLMFAMHYMNEYMDRFNAVKSDAALLQNAKAMYAIMEANPMVKDYYTKYTTDEIIDKVFDAESPTEALRRFDLFPYYRNDKTFVTPNLQNVGSLDNIKNAPTWSGLYFEANILW